MPYVRSVPMSAVARGLCVPAATLLMLVGCSVVRDGSSHAPATAGASAAVQTSRADDANDESAASAVAAALDSCNASRWPLDTAGTPIGKGSTWASGRIRHFAGYALFIPDSARVEMKAGARAGLSLAWSSCEGCRFGVGIQVDSTGSGIEGRVARLVAEQRVIDSVNKDPKAEAGEFNVIDGPPEPITTRAGRGYVINNDCGDCAATTVLFGRPGQIAAISLGGDDNVPMLPRHLCEMMAIAKSFSWSE